MVQKNTLNKQKIIIICGPTASGKSNLAIECAKILKTDVISADSMNIYKRLNIGVAKPSAEEMQGVTHHLIDVIDPFDKFTVSDYKKQAETVIKDLFCQNKIPIICGGTGFYINSILYDFSYGNGEGNPLIREKYKTLAETRGNEYVYSILCEKDIESAKKLHPNDVKRVIRALEIFENGVKKSDILNELVPKYDYRAYSFCFEREILYSRIDKRVDIMIKSGLVDEVQSLIDLGITLNNQCMQGIGYKEIYGYLKNEYSLDDAVEMIKLNTRHYAKRQITFFKKLQDLKYLEPQDSVEIAKRICKDL